MPIFGSCCSCCSSGTNSAPSSTQGTPNNISDEVPSQLFPTVPANNHANSTTPTNLFSPTTSTSQSVNICSIAHAIALIQKILANDSPEENIHSQALQILNYINAWLATPQSTVTQTNYVSLAVKLLAQKFKNIPAIYSLCQQIFLLFTKNL